MVCCIVELTISTGWHGRNGCFALDRVLIGAERLEKLFELYVKMKGLGVRGQGSGVRGQGSGL